jgi:spermidine dehydrogenase
MSERRDRKLGMDRNITRRDFLNGVAVGTGGVVTGSIVPGFAWEVFGASTAAQDQPGYYPPALTGLRGSHVGSFEAAECGTGNFLRRAQLQQTRKNYMTWWSWEVESAVWQRHISGAQKIPAHEF